MIYSAVEFQPGEMVFREGDQGSVMFLVQDGEVEILQDMGGIEKQIAILSRGDFFGEMSLLEKEPRSLSVRAVSIAKLIEIDRAGLQKMLVRNPGIAVRMVRKLSQRVTNTEDMLYRAIEAELKLKRQDQRPVTQDRGFLAEAVTGERFVVCHQSNISSVGRLDPANDIFPDIDLTACDPQFSVSRRHAKLLRGADGFQVLEEQATNGTYLNGKRISSKLPLDLRSGDEILFGAVKMKFSIEPAE